MRQIVLKKPRLGERGADDELILSTQGARADEGLQNLGSLRAPSSLQSRICTSDYRLNCLSGHLSVYKVYIFDLTV